MRKLEKVVCIKDGFMEYSKKQFCVKGKEYDVINELTRGFEIVDETGSKHAITLSKNIWFQLIYSSEQVDNLEKESDIVKNIKFRIGDKVKIAATAEGNEDLIGEEFEVIGIKENLFDKSATPSGRAYDLDGEANRCFWYEEELELADMKFEIITEGTTTTVKFEDGRTGTAKLYYKDTYNKGFGIVTALGRAIGIDLIEEVQKVVGSYVGKDTYAIKTGSTGKFKVGNFIKGIDRNCYGITNDDMTKAEVVDVKENGNIEIKVLVHKNSSFIGKVFGKLDGLNPKYFELIETPKYEKPSLKKPILKEEIKAEPVTFKVGDTVKVKNGLEAWKKYDELAIFTPTMQKYVGKSTSIYNIDSDGRIKLEECGSWDWTPSMLELITKEKNRVLTIGDFKIGDKVVPHAKTGCGYTEDFETEWNWKEAKEKGQPYLYVVGFEREKILILSHSKIETGGNYFLPTDITFYNEPKEEIKPEAVIFKVGDKVKMISENPKWGFGSVVKTGDIGIISKLSSFCDDIYVDFEGRKMWTAKPGELELIEEVSVITKEVAEGEFKIGDYIYFQSSIDKTYSVTKIRKIDEDGRLWGDWSEYIKVLPKTIKEFEAIKNNGDGYIRMSNPLLKKLVLIDDTEPALKVGDVVDKETAIKVIEAGGRIKLNDKSEYYMKDNKLHFAHTLSSGIQREHRSSGFGNLCDGDTFSIVEMPVLKEMLLGITEEAAPEITYEIGQELKTIEEVKEFIKIGGKVSDRDSWIYYEKKGQLKYKMLDGEKYLSDGYQCISLPATIHKLPKIKA